MKKELIEWGVWMAFMFPIGNIIYTIGDASLLYFYGGMVMFCPVTIILSKVICKVMGWNK